VICDLAGMGVERMVRLGTCTAVGRDAAGDRIEPGQAFVISTARCGDGASRALNGGEPAVEPDPALFQALQGIAGPAEVLSRDLVLRMDRLVPAARDRGEEDAGPPGAPGQAPLRDLQTAATLAAARKLGVAAAAILVVAEDESGQRIAEAELEKLFEPVATAVADVLKSVSNPQREG
jgi:uridine phosphorylase